jgi:hypothetical protein
MKWLLLVVYKQYWTSLDRLWYILISTLSHVYTILYVLSGYAFSTGWSLITPAHTVPVDTNANAPHLCQGAQLVLDARSTAWSTSCFRSLKPYYCHMFKSWWAWILVGEVRLIERSLLWSLVAMGSGDITECLMLLWPLVATVSGDITECSSLLWSWVAMGILCQYTRCYFGSLTSRLTMKLFNIASRDGNGSVQVGFIENPTREKM